MIIPKLQCPILILVFLATLVLAQEERGSMLTKMTDIAGGKVFRATRIKIFIKTKLDLICNYIFFFEIEAFLLSR